MLSCLYIFYLMRYYALIFFQATIDINEFHAVLCATMYFFSLINTDGHIFLGGGVNFNDINNSKLPQLLAVTPR